MDNEPPSEVIYYRLKMLDANGKVLFSDIKLVRNDRLAQDVYVLGNPFKDRIRLRFAKIPETTVKMELVNADGKLCCKFLFNQLTQTQIDLNTRSFNLPTGSYFLRIEADCKTFNRQLLRR